MSQGRQTPQRTKPEQLSGKDELNLADWRISVSTYQQPRKVDGGKLDLIEYEIPREDQATQKVTLMAPSVLGLPTPFDEDLLLVLLSLAKQNQFREDTLSFNTTDLCAGLQQAPNKNIRDRIEQGLTRLRAVTIKYELTWYNKLTAEVEPILITGILAEAKYVRRRGRPRGDEPRDSYIQWTKNFYTSIKQGNLTDIDLDLYFSFTRPGTKQLYRHLNKRFHGRRRNQTYERDLSHLACGHLGMTDSKDLKRNFHALVTELEKSGYLSKRDAKDRYSKVRPGVYRVHFDPPEATSKPKAAAVASDERGVGAGHKLVCEFHRLYSGREKCRPAKAELDHAAALLSAYGEELVFKVLPKVIVAMQSAGFGEKAKYFGAAVRFYETAIAGFEKECRERERERERREKETRETTERQAEISRRRERSEQLRTTFLRLPESERRRLQETVLAQTTPFLSEHIAKGGIDEHVAFDVLEEFARQSSVDAAS